MLVVRQVLLEVLLVAVELQGLADVLAVIDVGNDALLRLFGLGGVLRALEVIFVEVLLHLFALLEGSQVLVTTSTKGYILCLMFS